eukprot:4481277-Prymnesium_polylepis.2
MATSVSSVGWRLASCLVGIPAGLICAQSMPDGAMAEVERVERALCADRVSSTLRGACAQPCMCMCMCACCMCMCMYMQRQHAVPAYPAVNRLGPFESPRAG